MDEPEAECFEDCSDFVEADLPPPKKGTTKQRKTELKSRSCHMLNKSKKEHVAAHIMAINTEEIILKSLSVQPSSYQW